MSEVKLKDFEIIPEVVADYAAAEIVERSAFINSGIATGDYNNVDIKEGGNFVKVPFYNELTGDPEPLSEADDFALEVNGITTEADIGVIVRRGKAWGFNDIAEIASGEDISQELGKRIGRYWAKVYDRYLVKVASAAIDSLGNTHKLEVSKTIEIPMLIDAMGLLGDNQDEFTTIVMHSKVFTELQKQGVVEYAQTSIGEEILQTGKIPQILGRRVIVSDNVLVYEKNGKKVYRTFIAKSGAMYLGFQREMMTESDRDILALKNVISSHTHFCPHLRGVKWKSTIVNPIDEQLFNKDNWEKVYEAKAIRMVALETL